jgi:hypothetical protein
LTFFASYGQQFANFQGTLFDNAEQTQEILVCDTIQAKIANNLFICAAYFFNC